MKTTFKTLKHIAVLFFCVLFLFAGCKNTPSETQPAPSGGAEQQNTDGEAAEKIRLPLLENDVKNPYLALTRENRSLSSLYAQPLYRVTAEYAAKPVLAKQSRHKDRNLTVDLQTSTFSDGSPVTAADVVYSFEKAKASAWYSARLSKISAAAARKGSVEFRLTEPNVLAENLLTFPIVKRGSADDAQGFPTGSGLYILHADGSVEKNGKNGRSAAAPNVELESVKNPANLKNALEIGKLSFVFSDLQKGSYERVVAENTFVPMNNLVYLGFNHYKAPLNSAPLRTAIYYAVDKNGIAASAFQGCAAAAPLPIPPSVLKAQNIAAPSTAQNTEKAKTILQKLGYNRHDAAGKLSNGSQNLTFTVLVNQDNAFRLAAARHIAEALNRVGLSVQVESVPYEDYTARLASGEYTLYVGEVKPAEDLDLAPFFTAGGSGAGYTDLNLPSAQAAKFWHQGQQPLSAFCDTFLDDMPFVPLCYRCGMAAYDKDLQPDFTSASYDMYGDLAAWQFTSPQTQKKQK